MLPLVLNPDAKAPLVLTCEHASCTVPPPYEDLGLRREQLEDHIGWDIGAGAITEILARHYGATAVLSSASRLLVDCNRDLTDHDLMVAVSDGVPIPGNSSIRRSEVAQRIRDFYEPFHAEIDAVLKRHPPALLLSVHSFTPSMHGRVRDFDIGVLFDSFPKAATELGEALNETGLRVRYNQPYSGMDGLIYSAKRHGSQHGLLYLELEINNILLREDAGIRATGQRVVAGLDRFLASTFAGRD